MSKGWIALHRQILDDPLWNQLTPEHTKIMITLLLMANHKENQWIWKGKKYTVQPGQFITSINSIMEKAGKGISVRNVRTALKNLEKYNFLTSETTNQNTLITIANWGKYQDKALKVTSETADDRQTGDKRVTTNNNDNHKTMKQENNISDYDTFFEKIWGMYPKKLGKKDVKLAQRKILFKIGEEEMTRAIERYVKTTKGKEAQFIKYGSTFFNKGYYDYLDANYQEIEKVINVGAGDKRDDTVWEKFKKEGKF